MTRIKMLTFAMAAAALTLLEAGALAQSTVVDVENESAPSLTVLPPLPGRLNEEQLELAERLVKQLPEDTKRSDETSHRVWKVVQ